jgi:hypothetical protein
MKASQVGMERKQDEIKVSKFLFFACLQSNQF